MLKNLSTFILLIVALSWSSLSFAGAKRDVYDHIMKGNGYYNKKDYAKAQSEYEKALKIDPNSPEANYNRGTALVKSRKPGKVADSADSTLVAMASNHLLNAANSVGASTSLKTCAFYNAGRLYYDLGDYATAIDNYKAALRLSPDDWKARKNLRLAQKKLDENKITGVEYSISLGLGVNIKEEIENVFFDCQDGVCVINITVKEDSKSLIQAKEIPEDFSWN